jgi:hypothetical protein
MLDIHSTRPAYAHEHAAHRAVAADPVAAALAQGVADHGEVDRVEDDDRVVLHAQGRRRVDPVAVPAGRAQLGEDFVRVVPALGGDDDVALLQRLDVERVLQGGLVLRLGRGLAARVGSGEEDRLDEGEVALRLHAVHEDRADHAAPAHEADQRLLRLQCHRHRPFSLDPGSPRFVRGSLEGARDEPELF